MMTVRCGLCGQYIPYDEEGENVDYDNDLIEEGKFICSWCNKKARE